MQSTQRLLFSLNKTIGRNPFHHLQIHHRFIARRLSKEAALKTGTSKGVDRWMQAYEDFVGLTEVKQAQNNVIQAETKFLSVQEERRHQQSYLEEVQSRLRAVITKLEKTNRAEALYLDLVHKEHDIIREENDVIISIQTLEKEERDCFALLSSALRDSHEKERARAENTKYWSIIGSIIGAIIGITGTTINNYIRMKQLRELVSSAGENSEDLRNLSIQLCESVQSQSKKLDGLLVNLHASIVSGNAVNAQQYLDKIKVSTAADDLRKHTDNILLALKSHKSFESEVRELRRLLSENSLNQQDDKSVIYVGPEVETMMKQTEEHLERKIKYSALAAATFVYGALALTLPVVLSYFTGGS